LQKILSLAEPISQSDVTNAMDGNNQRGYLLIKQLIREGKMIKDGRGDEAVYRITDAGRQALANKDKEAGQVHEDEAGDNDGENNGGLIDPQTAKEIARTFSVRVYTIGVGSDGYAPKPIQTPLGVVMEREKVSIDEKLLTEIAIQTGGRYFRAKDNEGLAEIYSNIDLLEKTPVSLISSVRKQDKFFPFAAAALFFLFIEMLLRLTVFRKFP
jgi:predicted transcriptional regulator